MYCTYDMGLVATKPVFGVSDKVTLKSVPSSTGTSKIIEISSVASLDILKDFNYATLISPYIFKKTVDCKLPLLR